MPTKLLPPDIRAVYRTLYDTYQFPRTSVCIYCFVVMYLLAAMNMSTQFFFVPTTSTDSTTRDRELQRADIRKHAATIAHRRKIVSSAQPDSPPRSRSNATPRHRPTVLDVNPLGLAEGTSTYAIVSSPTWGEEFCPLGNATDYSPRPSSCNFTGRSVSRTEPGYFCGTIPWTERSVFEDLELLSNSTDADTGYGEGSYSSDQGMCVESSSSSLAILRIDHNQSASFCRALEYCTFSNFRTTDCVAVADSHSYARAHTPKCSSLPHFSGQQRQLFRTYHASVHGTDH